MRKFRFRLQSVLNYQRRLEEEAKAAYQAAMSKRIEIEMEINNLGIRRDIELARPIAGLESLLTLMHYVDRLDRERGDLEIAQDILLQEEEAAKLAWIEARKSAEAIEKLRTKQLEEYQLEASRAEQRDLDEWAITRRAA